MKKNDKMAKLIGQNIKGYNFELPFKKETFEQYYLFILKCDNVDNNTSLKKLKSLFANGAINDINIEELNNSLYIEYLKKNDIKLPIRSDFGFIFKAVKKVIDNMDAYDLLENGCPKDEFDNESWWISNDLFVNNEYSSKYIAELIEKTFNHGFYEDYKSPNKYVKEAKLISVELADYFQKK